MRPIRRTASRLQPIPTASTSRSSCRETRAGHRICRASKRTDRPHGDLGDPAVSGRPSGSEVTARPPARSSSAELASSVRRSSIACSPMDGRSARSTPSSRSIRASRRLRTSRQPRKHANFSFTEGDTRDIDATRRIGAESLQPEVIFDFAARAGVRDSLTDPWLYISINVEGLQNSLRVAAELGAKYVFASSSSVYGDDDRQPFHEDQMRARPISPYGATKVAGEALVHAHHATTGLPVAIARFFTVFGPRQRPDLAIHKFATNILKGEPVELYGEGQAASRLHVCRRHRRRLCPPRRMSGPVLVGEPRKPPTICGGRARRCDGAYLRS